MSRFLIFLLLILSLSSCDNDNVLPLEVKVVLLDINQNPKESFLLGEKITFALQVDNRSNSDIVWYSWCEVIQNTKLYEVYEIKFSVPLKYIGSPLSPPIDCQDIPIILKPGKNYYLKFGWDSNQSNQPLTAGNYKIISKPSFKIDGYAEKSEMLSADFVVKQ